MEIEVSCRPARERCHAEVHASVEPAPDLLALESVPVQRGAAWVVERWTTMKGRVVAQTLPASATVACSVVTGSQKPQMIVPWEPVEYGYAVAPSARWVMDPSHMIAQALRVEQVAPCEGERVISARYGVRALLSDEAGSPMYSYRSGKRWIDCSAAMLPEGSSMVFHVEPDEPLAVLVVGSFSRPPSGGGSLLRVGGEEEPSVEVFADDDDTVLVSGSAVLEPLSSRSMLGSGALTAVLVWTSHERCGIWTAAHGKAPTGASVTSSGLLQSSGECVIGGYGSGCVVVEAAVWSGPTDPYELRSQVGSLLSYYNARRR